MRKLGYLQKFGYFSLELCPKLRTSKIRHDKSIALSTKLVIGVRGKIEFGGARSCFPDKTGLKSAERRSAEPVAREL